MLALARQHALDRVQFGRHIELVPGDPAPTGRDTRRHRRRRGDPAGRCRRTETRRSGLPAGEGRGRPGGADRRTALPAGARWYRLHRRTRAASPCQAGVDLGRTARQRTRTDPRSGCDVARQGICAAAGAAVVPRQTPRSTLAWCLSRKSASTSISAPTSVSRQAKDPLGDDVSLYFGRAAGDGRREGAQVAIEPAAEM